MRSTSGAKVVHTIVESGEQILVYICHLVIILRLHLALAALYCAILLALIVTEAVGSNVFFVFNEAVSSHLDHAIFCLYADVMVLSCPL